MKIRRGGRWIPRIPRHVSRDRGQPETDQYVDWDGLAENQTRSAYINRENFST